MPSPQGLKWKEKLSRLKLTLRNVIKISFFSVGTVKMLFPEVYKSTQTEYLSNAKGRV